MFSIIIFAFNLYRTVLCHADWFAGKRCLSSDPETQFSSPMGLPSARYHLWAIPTKTSIISLLLYIDLKQVTSLRDPEEEEEEKEEKSKSPAGSTCVKQHVAERHNNNVASYLLEPSVFFKFLKAYY